MSNLDLLRRVPIFEGLPDDTLEQVAKRLPKQMFAKGVVLFHKDSPDNNGPKPSWRTWADFSGG